MIGCYVNDGVPTDAMKCVYKEAEDKLRRAMRQWTRAYPKDRNYFFERLEAAVTQLQQ
jgi:hypothetical protein